MDYSTTTTTTTTGRSDQNTGSIGDLLPSWLSFGSVDPVTQPPVNVYGPPSPVDVPQSGTTMQSFSGVFSKIEGMAGSAWDSVTGEVKQVSSDLGTTSGNVFDWMGTKVSDIATGTGKTIGNFTAGIASPFLPWLIALAVSALVAIILLRKSKLI